MKTVLKSKRIYTEGGVVDGYLTIENGLIIDISECAPEASYIDLKNQRIIPGIIDIHNHGFGGWSMTDPATKDDVVGFAKALTSVGVTAVLPTAKEEAFEAIADTMLLNTEGATILGIHSEGPFWARGGENTIGDSYPAPSIKETKRLLEVAKGHMTMMAIAPEVQGAKDVIKYLHQQKVKVAGCHTAAYYSDIAAVNSEVKLDIVTHLGNGMRGFHHRDVGALGAFLLADNLYYELITDLNHICKEMIQIFFKLQPYDKFCLISDSNYIAGLPTGTYMRYGRAMVANEKGLILNSDNRICGSGKWVLSNMGQLEKELNIPFNEIVKMASLNPAKYLGIQDERGSIKIGKIADIAVIDDQYECQMTFVNGLCVYNQKTTNKASLFNELALEKRISDKCTL